jgi:hypothetical protein
MGKQCTCDVCSGTVVTSSALKQSKRGSKQCLDLGKPRHVPRETHLPQPRMLHERKRGAGGNDPVVGHQGGQGHGAGVLVYVGCLIGNKEEEGRCES